jgi:hypothetical protein
MYVDSCERVLILQGAKRSRNLNASNPPPWYAGVGGYLFDEEGDTCFTLLRVVQGLT